MAEFHFTLPQIEATTIPMPPQTVIHSPMPMPPSSHKAMLTNRMPTRATIAEKDQADFDQQVPAFGDEGRHKKPSYHQGWNHRPGANAVDFSRQPTDRNGPETGVGGEPRQGEPATPRKQQIPIKTAMA